MSVVYEGFRLRSTEVDRGRSRSTDIARVFRAFVGRPDGFGSSDFAHIVHCLMLYRSIWVSGADSMTFTDLLAEEGSTFSEHSGQSRSVGRNTVSFIARRPEGVRS